MVNMRSIGALLLCAGCLWAQADTKQRVRTIRDLGKLGSESIPQLEPHLSDPSVEVRVEAVKAIVNIGGSRSLDPLITATRDNDPEVQIRATDGLVNFYSPGYLRTGLSGSIRRAGTAVRGKFSDTNDLIIEPYVEVRPEVISALAALAGGGGSMEARANAARALGILRGKAGVDDLIAALRTKDDLVMYEALIALQKIRDESSGPRAIFLMRDLNDRVQIAAIELVGLLRTKEAVPDLVDLVKNGRNIKARRAALTALAMIPDEKQRPVFSQHLAERDEGLRGAAAEGLGRIGNAEDLPVVSQAFEAETKMNPRLSLAFAAVYLGRNELSEFSPLRYLVNTLNSAAYRGVAQPFLAELARNPGVRRTLYGALNGGTRHEKIYLGQIIAQTGDAEAVKYLEMLSSDADTTVAAEGLRSLKVLRARGI
jgi:HEAT repeat protein